MPDLTSKQAAFASEYLGCFNASEAARRAGYSKATAYSQGQRLLKNVEVQAAIKARLAEVAMAAAEVLARKTALARGEFGHPLDEFLDVNVDKDGKGQWVYDWAGAKAAGKLGLLIEFARCGRGEITKVLLDVQTGALDTLAKAHRIGAAPTGDGDSAESALTLLRAALREEDA